MEERLQEEMVEEGWIYANGNRHAKAGGDSGKMHGFECFDM
jgi:hypothetical protein